MSVENISKLPQWAQRKIKLLERKVHDLEQSLASVPVTQIMWGSELLGPHGYIPTDKAIRFSLDLQKPYRWIEFRLDGDKGIEVYGSTQLMVHLNSSNHMHLNTDEKGVY